MKASAHSELRSRLGGHILVDQLVAQGFYEMMANSLTTASYIPLDESLSEEKSVKLLNPLSQMLSPSVQPALWFVPNDL